MALNFSLVDRFVSDVWKRTMHDRTLLRHDASKGLLEEFLRT